MADGTLIFDTKIDDKGFKESTGGLAGLAEKGLGVLTGNLMTEAVGKVVDIGKNAIKTGMSFETASSQIAATMGTTVEALTSDMDKYFGKTTINGEEFYGSLIDLASELGAKTKFTATEAAEGLNILAQSGLNAQDQMAAMPTVLNLAAAGSMDLSNAASFVTGAVKGFGDEMNNAQYYADLMAKGATLANTDVQGLGEALSGASATAKSYGQDAEEVTLALLRLAEQNVTGSVATTALNRAMADLYTPTDTASTALEKLGVSAYTLEGKARPVNEVMDDLNAAMSNMSDEERNAYKNSIFTAQGLSAFNKITSTSTDKVDDFREELQGASDGFGSAAEQAQIMSDNLEGDITIMGSAMDGFYNAVYSKMQKPLRSMVQFGTSAVSKLTDGLKTGGIGGMVKAGAGIVSDFVSGAVASLPTLLDTGKEFIGNIVSGITDNLGDIDGSAADAVGRFAAGLLTDTLSIIQSGWGWVVDLSSGVLEKMPDIIDAGGDLLSGFIDSFLQPENIGSLIDQGTAIAGKLINSIIDNVPKIAAAGWQFIGKLGTAITDNLPYLIAKGKQVIAKIIQGVKDKLPEVLKKGKETADKFGDGIKDKFPEMLEKGEEIIGKVGSGISGVASNLYGKARSAANFVTSGFNSISFSSIGTSIINKIKTGITDAASGLYTTVVDVAKTAYQKMVDLFTGGGSDSDGGGGSTSFGSESGSGPAAKSGTTHLTYSGASPRNSSSGAFLDAVNDIESGRYLSAYAAGAEMMQRNNEIDYDRLGEAVSDALDGAEVKMDGYKVGEVVTPYVSENIANDTTKDERGVI